MEREPEWYRERCAGRLVRHDLSSAARELERGREVGRELRRDVDRLSRDGMREAEAARVEELALEPEIAARRRRPGRRSPGGRSPRGGRGSGACAPSRAGRRAARARASSRRTSNHVTASRGVGVSSEWRVRSRRSRPIGASIRPDAERGAPRTSAAYVRSTSRVRIISCSSVVRLLRAGDDEQAGRVAVEAVHDPGPVVVVSSLGAVLEQPLDERARPRRPGRMDDEPGRLVDDEQVLVLPDDRDVERLRLAAARLGDLDRDLLPPLEPEALRPRLAVDEHDAVGDQPLGERARLELGARGEDAIEPRAGLQLRNAKAELCQGEGSSGRPRRTRRTAARRRRR